MRELLGRLNAIIFFLFRFPHGKFPAATLNFPEEKCMWKFVLEFTLVEVRDQILCTSTYSFLIVYNIYYHTYIFFINFKFIMIAERVVINR